MRNVNLDLDQLNQHIERLKTTQQSLQNTCLADLTNAQLVALVKNLGEVTGQIKAFTQIIESEISDHITIEDKPANESLCHFIRRTGAYHLRTRGIRGRFEA